MSESVRLTHSVAYLPPNLYLQFNSLSAIGKKFPNYKTSPEFADTIHCVAFVVDAAGVSLLPMRIIEKFQIIRSTAQQMGKYAPFIDMEYK